MTKLAKQARQYVICVYLTNLQRPHSGDRSFVPALPATGAHFQSDLGNLICSFLFSHRCAVFSILLLTQPSKRLESLGTNLT